MVRLAFVLLSGAMLFLGAAQSFGYVVKSVQVSGDKEADVAFQVSTPQYSTPTLNVLGNVVEVTFPGLDLADEVRDHGEANSPHALIHRIATYSSEPGTVKTRIVINGSPDDLANRVHLVREGDKVRLSIAYPKGQTPATSLLNDENLPVSAGVAQVKVAPKELSFLQIFMVLLTLIMAGAGTYFFAKFMKKRGNLSGSRKYLVEQMSYCPLGTKTGVSLLRVGNEFVLVGVTPNQVTMLSALPKLQSQYESDTSLEREHFKVAVEDELTRLRPNTGIRNQ